MNDLILPKRKTAWDNVLFFSVTTLVAVLAAPFYAARFGIQPFTLWLTVFYIFATSMSITAGYHRLFSHATYKANPVLEFLFLFFGAASYQQSALRWSSQHRIHHLYVDTDLDPYSIRKGFFYAHIGWLLFWQHPDQYENAKDLQKDRMLMHQHQYYAYWSAISGIVVPMLIGFWRGDLMGAFIFAVCVRMFVVHQTTFCINSVCHTFGKSTYDIYSSAKDNAFVAFLTNGEGYHNFHHHFPSDYRNGVRWYQWDPTKWLIAVLSWARLTKDLKRVSNFRIIAARLAAEKQRAEDYIKIKTLPNLKEFQAMLNAQQEKLKITLREWESSAREYQVILREHLERRAAAKKAKKEQDAKSIDTQAERERHASLKKTAAQRRFRETLERWESMYLTLEAA